jgi:triosephosphate isomerase
MNDIKMPIIIINFKTYTRGTGKAALKLAKIADEISEESKICIAVSPQFTDLSIISKEVHIPVLAQHIDPILPGSNTGHILPEAVKEAGAIGTLINHSEKRISIKVIKEIVKRTKEIGLVSVVCADTPQRTHKAASFKPNMVAIEPPELIGTGIPVSKAKPEIVKRAVGLVKDYDPKITVLCGAGITKGEDVIAALKLGAQGVLLASGVVKAQDQRKAILDLVNGLKNSQIKN